MIEIKTEALLSARVRLPLRGAWVADVVLDGPAVTGAITIHTGGAGGLDLVGTVIDSGTVETTTTLRVVGGAGGLATITPGKDYASIPVRVIVADLLSLAGETLDDSSTEAVLEEELDRWTSIPGTVAEALDELVSVLDGVAWRVLPSGKVWIGRETWPAVSPPHVLTDLSPSRRWIEIAPEALTLVPGTTFRNVLVSEVEHAIDGRSIKTRLYYARSADETDDRLKRSLRRIVEHYTAPLDRYALYGGRVVVQSDDLQTVDVQPDDARLPPMVKVPLRLGIPGTTVELEQNARVLIGFDAGEPTLPFALVPHEGGLKKIKITASAKVVIQCPDVRLGDEDDARPVARIGDPVQLLLDPTTIVTGSLVGPTPGVLTGNFIVPGVMYGVIVGGGKVKAS